MNPTEAEVQTLVREILGRLQQQGVAVAAPARQQSGPAPTAHPAAKPASSTAGRKLVTVEDMAGVAPGGHLDLAPGAIVTPLAQDMARERGVDLRTTAAVTPMVAGPSAKAVAIGADHGGYSLKEQLKTYLADLGYETVDVGTHGTASVDYPDFAFAVAGLVAQGRCASGIVVDGAGIGSCMVANKVPGVRASLCYDVSSAANAREHNHANVLTLGAGLVGPGLARQIVRTWLETSWGGDRHARRVEKITAIEQRYAKK